MMECNNNNYCKEIVIHKPNVIEESMIRYIRQILFEEEEYGYLHVDKYGYMHIHIGKYGIMRPNPVSYSEGATGNNYYRTDGYHPKRRDRLCRSYYGCASSKKK
jgi:hypothetical protein